MKNITLILLTLLAVDSVYAYRAVAYRGRVAPVNVHRNVNVNVHADYGMPGYHPVARTAAVVGTAAVTAAVVGSIVHSVPPSCVNTVVGGVTYSQCGSTWYQPRASGTTVEYVVVNPPV